MQQTNDLIREVWNKNAAFWDERMGDGNEFVEILVWPPTERLLELRSGERVLDIACGSGLSSRRLAAMGAEVIACDYAEQMIARARRRSHPNAERIQYLILDATDEAQLLALGERRFDVALCHMALFDMADLHPLIARSSKQSSNCPFPPLTDYRSPLTFVSGEPGKLFSAGCLS
jgi:2-polyprenyl-3-methyl-5-hydroxy-6-metoxy-1,4-benzoquinol methylase